MCIIYIYIYIDVYNIYIYILMCIIYIYIVNIYIYRKTSLQKPFSPVFRHCGCVTRTSAILGRSCDSPWIVGTEA